ncbi:hypothetical protein ACROYT_G004035 [Oculina patagonica]
MASRFPDSASESESLGKLGLKSPSREVENENDFSGKRLQDAARLNITLASDANGWNKAVNGQLLIELAQDTRVKLFGFVPKYTPQQKEHARNLNIELVDAKDLPGYSPVELLAYPPDSLDIDILIIHSYGRDLGRQAQIIRETKKCKWVHVVHTISEELEKFLEKSASSAVVQESEHELQTTLCERADLVIAIGPKVAEAYKSALRFCGKDRNVIDLTPGITEEFLGVRQMIGNAGEKFRVLISGSSKYFKVKGSDIAAKAINLVQDPSCHLIFVGQPNDNVAELEKALLKEGINLNQLTVRKGSGGTDYWRRLLCEVDLVIKPSRTEGFGMSGLRAISADLPILVSGNCGLGIVLKKLPSGGQHVVESDDPQVWADKIKEVRAMEPKARCLESEKLRKEYVKQFSWKDQCDRLVETMFTMVPTKSEHLKEAVECQCDIDEAENRLQSMKVNADNVDGRSHVRDQEVVKTGIEEMSLFPSGCDVVDRGVPLNTAQVNTRLSTVLANLPLAIHRRVCMMLNIKRDLKFDDFRMLAEKVGFDRDWIRCIEQMPNPTDEILKTWSSKSQATVGNLIELLKGEDLERMDVAKVLEDWVNESSYN